MKAVIDLSNNYRVVFAPHPEKAGVLRVTIEAGDSPKGYPQILATADEPTAEVLNGLAMVSR